MAANRTPFRQLAFFLAAVLVVGAIAGSVGYYSYRQQRDDLLTETLHDLGAIADLKVHEIVFWRQERIATARAIAENPLLTEDFVALAHRPGDANLRRRIRRFAASLHKNFSFEVFALFDDTGAIILADGLELAQFREFLQTDFRAALTQSDVLLTDLHEMTPGAGPHMGLYVPIGIASGAGPKTRLFLYLQINPQTHLFPLLQTWPTPSASGETLLVRREGEEVVFLNELRHRAGTALRLRLPLNELELPAAAAVRGVAALAAAKDYRGRRVLAASRPVPDSPWFLVAKIDRDEIFLRIQARGRLLALVSILAFALTNVFILLLWRQQRVSQYRRELDLAARHQAESERSAASLRRMTENLERSNRELEQFAYVASHDLQEPLRMISSFLSLLEKEYRGRLSAEADEYIHYAVDGATRLQTMIRDLLAYSRAGASGNPLEPTDCELALRRVLDNLKVLVEESGAEITHDPLPIIDADPTQIKQLLQNLIENGIKYRGDERPRIHLAAVREGEDWLFSVTDNGIGIDPKHRERIFQIFQRLHRHGKYAGTGIGLAVCRRIVERHGGRIWVESEPGKGSVFIFSLPADPARTNGGERP